MLRYKWKHRSNKWKYRSNQKLGKSGFCTLHLQRSLKPVSHCAISCGAMLHRRRLPDIAQCERFCDAIAGDFSTIASNRLASRDFELVQKCCCNQSDDMRSLAFLRWIFGGPRKGRRFPSNCGGISACQPITIAWRKTRWWQKYVRRLDVTVSNLMKLSYCARCIFYRTDFFACVVPYIGFDWGLIS